MKKLVEKYSSIFNKDSTIVQVANYLILDEELNITANAMAELVQMIFESYGLQVKTTGQCISWYKNKLRKDNSKAKVQVEFKKYLESCNQKDKNKVLLDLANKYQDELIKCLKDEDMKIEQPTV